MEVFPALSACSLFAGLTQDEIAAILPACLRLGGLSPQAVLLRAGDESLRRGRTGGRVAAVSGATAICWLRPGPVELFAEAFACDAGARAIERAVQNGRARFVSRYPRGLFSLRKGMRAAPDAVTNLIRVLAEKNMQLNEKAGYLSRRSKAREKLLAYLSAQARRTGSASFRIPFDRQQLADFLSVNRSAMSAELSKMQREGLLRAERSDFTLFQPE
ncbi:MAG: Crp/Fnr family transcriptional regulator [Blautia wexlerae]